MRIKASTVVGVAALFGYVVIFVRAVYDLLTR